MQVVCTFADFGFTISGFHALAFRDLTIQTNPNPNPQFPNPGTTNMRKHTRIPRRRRTSEEQQRSDEEGTVREEDDASGHFNCMVAL